ncbi:5'-3' exoribonuclease 2, partial [Tulasnella sp. 418]
MGVPALFRWLSKKYPKIVASVVEEEATTVPDALGNPLELPVDISSPNPNGVELDNLYLDMNGIVHPCTHPEGRPAPETEEEMMIEVFRYTERVVNMVRPRKLLFMAIDGVAPRAKMNQQRSRRFRSAQEAKEKEEERKEAIAIFEAMGHTVSDETKEKKSWDSNAITPGTPFMTLLANSLRYWVVQKMNTDPGWKNLQVIISDASVPGEGEHKIMDWIRRQRVSPDHDPNTQHVIYGLDADLIMLALATHEPHFRVLREDVFAQDKNSRACRICGQEGHLAAQCTGEKKFNLGNENKENKETKPVEKKPFIFLDVSILREYLEIELNVPQSTFPFDLEVAIDDWIFLIFLVGNDFLPHLPSLEIREGAIDTLLKIWKKELSRMGGYVTNHGHVVLDRAQVILEGLSSRENEIFKKRREAEERQDQNAKRRKIDEQNRQNNTNGRNTPQNAGSVSNGIPYVPVPVANSSQRAVSATLPSSLPPRPTFDMFLQHDPDPASSTSQAQEREVHLQNGTKAMGGSNHDVVANRKAIRMANMTAAEALKAEMSGLTKLGRSPVQSISAKSIASAPATEAETGPSVQMEVAGEEVEERSLAEAEAIINTQGGQEVEQGEESSIIPDTATEMLEPTFSDDTPGEDSIPTPMETDMPGDQSPEGEAHGIKRKLEDVEAEEAEDQPLPEEEEDQEAA